MKKATLTMADARALASCSLCGLCQTVCPVFRATRRAGDGPRDKIAILRAWQNGAINDRQCAESVARCLLCSLCARVCPAQIPLNRVFRHARALLRANFHLGWRQRAFLAALAASPKITDKPQKLLAFCQTLALEGYIPEALRKPGPIMFRLAPKPFSAPQLPETAGNRPRVLLYPGCLARGFLPTIAQACVRALDAAGLEPVFAPSLLCCGRLQASLGRTKTATSLVRQNLKIIGALQFDLVATPCPECLATITKIWPELVGLNSAEKELATRLAAKTFDISVALAHHNFTSQSAIPPKAIWHRPCLLPDAAEDAALKITSHAGENPLASRSPCCGGFPGLIPATIGAALQNKPAMNPPEKIAGAARDEFAIAGAALVITACPACVLRLNHGFRRRGDKIRARHCVEVFAQRSPCPPMRG